MTKSVAEAKRDFSALLRQVENGQEVQISRSGHPVAKLVPLPRQATRNFGVLGHAHMPREQLLAATDEAELALWE